MSEGPASDADPVAVEILAGHDASVGEHTVNRVLPQRTHRTIGAWCFADVMTPIEATGAHGFDIGPHPHMGLATVTWLLEGEALHRDSLGSEQLIMPGQLNLMTAGHGVSHSEEATGTYQGIIRGVQLWVAQPEATRNGPAAFEHHEQLPRVALDGGDATVLVGTFEGHTSPARHDTPLVGVDLHVERPSAVALDPSFEHAVIVLDGAVLLEGQPLHAGSLGYLSVGRDEIELSVATDARLLLLGGTPFGETITMWWNFVGRTRDEMIDAHASWTRDDGRFGTVASALPRIETRPPHFVGRAPGSEPPSSGSPPPNPEQA